MLIQPIWGIRTRADPRNPGRAPRRVSWPDASRCEGACEVWIQGGVEEVIEMLDGRDTGRARRDEQRAHRPGEGAVQRRRRRIGGSRKTPSGSKREARRDGRRYALALGRKSLLLRSSTTLGPLLFERPAPPTQQSTACIACNRPTSTHAGYAMHRVRCSQPHSTTLLTAGEGWMPASIDKPPSAA